MDQEKRIAELEQRVERLEALVRGKSTQRPTPARDKQQFDLINQTGRRFLEFVSGEGAIARVGIALVLAGLLFLVKLAIDSGWLGETERVLVAVASGVVLIAAGFRITGRLVLPQILMGGGVGALYIAVFAAHVFYDLIGFPLAMVAASGVTVLCLFLSLSRESFTLASVAILAGLSTPFMLSSGQGSLAGLSGYLLAVQVAAALVYWLRGWASTHVMAGAFSLLAAFLAAVSIDSDTQLVDQLWLQATILVGLGTFVALPLFRAPETENRLSKLGIKALPGAHLMAAWVLILAAWELERWGGAWLAAGMAIGVGVLLYGWSGTRNYRGSFVSAVAFLSATALFAATDGRGFALTLVVGAVIQWIGRTDRKLVENPVGLGIVLVGSFIVIMTLLFNDADHTWEVALYHGLGVAAVILAARWNTAPRLTLGAGWLLTLLYLQQEFSHLGELTGAGTGLVTAAWAALAIGLLSVGVARRADAIRLGGALTLGLVIAKLVLFDLGRLDPVWRILVFVGIGVALLATSWFFPQLWRSAEEDLASAEPDSSA